MAKAVEAGKRCAMGSECEYLAECAQCGGCWEHCHCGDPGGGDDHACHHGVGFDQNCTACEDELQ